MSARRNTAARQAWRASGGGLAAVAIFTAFINILKFATPLFLLQALDRVPESRSVGTLVMLTIAALIAVVAAVVLDAIRGQMLVRWAAWVGAQFGPRLVREGLAASRLDDSPSIQNGLGDLAKVQTFVTRNAGTWLDVFWAPLFIVGVYLVHPLLGGIAAAAVLLLLLLGWMQEATTRSARVAAREASGEASELMSSAERHLEAVGAHAMTGNLAERWWQSTAVRLDERERSDRRAAVFRAMIRGLGECARIGMIAVGIWLYIHDSLTLGGVFAARVMMGFGYRLLERSVRSWRNYRDAVQAYRRIRDGLAGEQAAASIDDRTSVAPLLLERVSYRYPNQRENILRSLSLSLEPGQMVLVIGAAGTGKTTLCRLLVGLLSTRYGQVKLGDVEIARLPPESRARLLGYLPQYPHLLPGTVRENIARMGSGQFGEVLAAAKLAAIHEIITRLPSGYDTEIAEGAVGLSGSERRRIELARAIYGRPRLLVLDEPAAFLDRAARRALKAAVADLKRTGSTVVVTTQSSQATRWNRLADKVLTLGVGSFELSEVGRRPAAPAADAARPRLRPVP